MASRDRPAVGVALEVETQLVHRSPRSRQEARRAAAQLGEDEHVAVAAGDVAVLVLEARSELIIIE